MADIQRYIPPNLRQPLREAGALGYSLLDNVVGLDDGFDSAGEQFGRAVRQDPVGMARAMGSGLLSGAQEAVMHPIDTARGVVQDVAGSFSRAARGADSYLPEGVDLKNATMDQMRAANDAYLADMVGVAGVVPAARLAGGAARAAGNIDAGALTADAIGTARAIGSGDMGLLGEVFQRSGVPQDLSAARAKGPMRMRGSDYFPQPRGDGGRAKDPAMSSPFSATKSKVAPYEFDVEGRYLGQNQIPQLVMPEQKLGTRMFFAAGDRTAGDVEITRVNERELRRPVVMRAGPEYMDSGDTWASHSGVLVPKYNVLRDFADRGEKLEFAYSPMGERSGDFAKHQAELYAEMLYSSEMPRKSVSAVNELMRDIVSAKADKDLKRENKAREKKGLKPLKRSKSAQVPSIDSEGFREWFASQPAETVRKPFLMKMDGAVPKALEGVPDVGEARFAATNPNLVQSESYSTGFRFGTPDVSRGLLPSDHPSYDTKFAAAPDTVSSTFGFDLPWTIGARDTALPRLAEAAKKTGQFRAGQNELFSGRQHTLPSDQRVFTMNPKTSQIVDQQYVDEASTYKEFLQNEGKARAEIYERGLLDAYLRGR